MKNKETDAVDETHRVLKLNKMIEEIRTEINELKAVDYAVATYRYDTLRNDYHYTKELRVNVPKGNVIKALQAEVEELVSKRDTSVGNILKALDV